MTPRAEIYDVVQIGYGPVGQTNAALLGRLGARVAVFERHPSLYGLPRAGHIDHEIMRVFQTLGAAGAIEEDAFRCANYGWRNQNGETLLDIDWSQDGVSGWPSDYLMYQPHIEVALDAAARRPTVEVYQGWEALSVTPHDDHVEVVVARAGPEAAGADRHTVRCRYLIGADGANSLVRTAADIEFEDLGFREQWLVVDFRQKRPLSFEFDNGQICDPARPLCLFQLGKMHRRFEFMVMPGDDCQEIVRPESVWSLVSRWMTPEDADLIRSTVYTFRSANAVRWREGRIFLIGDAAHLMPPFLGQGMCSGVRDAANLAWKLGLVLRGLSGEEILDTYELERKPHVGNIIEQAVALGKVSCTIDPEEAAKRDHFLMNGLAPPPPPFPWVERGILQSHPSQAAAAVVGRLGPQGVVEAGASSGRADDVIGSGWQLICKSFVPPEGERAKALMADLDIKVIDLDGAHAGAAVDVQGAYARFFEESGVDALLVRPDFYIFGAVAGDERVEALLEDLAQQLSFAPSGAAPGDRQVAKV